MNLRFTARQLLTFGFLLLAVFPYFFKLGDCHIWLWDEARYVNNAIEMLWNGDFWHVKIDGQTDRWNFKPPFALWWQVLAMRLGGINEWSVRMPSAIAATGTVLLVFRYAAVVLRSPAAAWIAGLILVGSFGWMKNHGARTADLDAILTLLLTTQTLFFLEFLHEKGSKTWKIWLVGLATACAFLTKGMPGFFFLPWLALVAVLHGNHRFVFFEKKIYAMAVLTAALVGWYYWQADAADPGYWQALKKSEFGRWDASSMPWHIQPWDFYWTTLRDEHFRPFAWLLPTTWLLPFLFPDPTVRRQSLYLNLVIWGYFVFVSLPPIKLSWYDVPMFPFFALLLGLVAVMIFRFFEKWFSEKKYFPLVRWASIALLAVFLARPYFKTLKTFDYHPEKAEGWDVEGAYLKILSREMPELLRFSVLKKVGHPGEHYDSIKFYQKAYRQHRGAEIKIFGKTADVQPPQFVVVSQAEMADSLSRMFRVDTVHRWGGCMVLSVSAQ